MSVQSGAATGFGAGCGGVVGCFVGLVLVVAIVVGIIFVPPAVERLRDAEQKLKDKSTAPAGK